MSPLIFFFLLFLPFATSTSFFFPSFNTSSPIRFENDTFFDKVIKLTKNELVNSITGSVGRAIYHDPIPIHNIATGDLTDFFTQFSFSIYAINNTCFGDGLTFFLAPSPSNFPPDSSGRGLGLTSEKTPLNATNKFVAIEFDTFKNEWDPSSDHVGIDINSIQSVATVNWSSSLKDGRTGHAQVTYNASTKNLSVFLSYDQDAIFESRPALSYTVDLREVLPEMAEVGFSASTGSCVETHNILSWDFSSNLMLVGGSGRRKSGVIGWGIGVSLILGLLLLIGGFVWFFVWRRRIEKEEFDEEDLEDISFDDEFERGRGPKRFSYRELADATREFDEGMKLGEGGFGGVYKGVLKGCLGDVAIKRVSRGSKQGKKEYVAEVRIISRLRHRNLVQLVGWCHGKGELILVYEFLPNGSLDGYLYDTGRFLAWHLRYY